MGSIQKVSSGALQGAKEGPFMSVDHEALPPSDFESQGACQWPDEETGRWAAPVVIGNGPFHRFWRTAGQLAHLSRCRRSQREGVSSSADLAYLRPVQEHVSSKIKAQLAFVMRAHVL